MMTERRTSDATGTKRKRTAGGTPAPRKRARTSTPHARTAPRRRNPKQSTLTQIDFVKSSSFSSIEDQVAHFEPIVEPPALSREGTTKSFRDSTLTQLDFVTTAPSAGKPDVFSAIEEPVVARPPRVTKRESTLTQMEYFRDTETTSTIYDDNDERMSRFPDELRKPILPPVPQFDSATEHEASAVLEDESMPPPAKSRLKKKSSTKNIESQEYEPTQSSKKRNVAGSTSVPATNRRRSARRNADDGQPIRPPLLVQDTTDFDTQEILQQKALLPSTPVKSRGSIPSSQTPESIKISTRQRKPLGEISVNLQISPLKSAKKNRSENRYSPVKKPSPKRSKICTLKVPSKAFLPRGSKDDSQADTWSLQPTSSPKKSNSSRKKRLRAQPVAANQPSIAVGPQDEQLGSDPPIVANRPVIDAVERASQESLPDLSEIFRNPRSKATKTKTWQILPLSDTSDNVLQTGEIPPNSTENTTNMVPEIDNSEADEDFDFGTPIRNDTQFVTDLVQRVSSPLPSSEIRAPEAHEPDHLATSAPTAIDFASAPQLIRAGSEIMISPFQVPRLVPSPARQLSKISTKSTLESFSAGARSRKRTSQIVRTTQVPLNDTEEYRNTSSSSPRLPPVPQDDTQRSIRPAPLPRQSQISTQAPSTQGLVLTPTGGTMPALRTQDDGSPQRIVIKDSSSSFRRRISQLQDKHDHNHDDEFDLMDDLDLDPSTMPPLIHQDEPDRPREKEDDITQTPTQKSRYSTLKRRATTQESPIILGATTRSQRDAKLEVIALPSSSQPQVPPRTSQKMPRVPPILPYPKFAPIVESRASIDDNTLGERGSRPEEEDVLDHDIMEEDPPSSSIPTSDLSPSPPRTLKRKYSPIPGFDNDTQCDFTQNGHITAAYIHRGRDEGWLPKDYVPKPYKPKNWQTEGNRSGKKVRNR